MGGRDGIPYGANVSYLEAKLNIQQVYGSGYFRMKRYNTNVEQEIEKSKKKIFCFTFGNILLNIWIVSFLCLFLTFFCWVY